MNDLIRRTLDEHAQAEPLTDIEGLLRMARARVRRRRATAIAVSAAVVALAAAPITLAVGALSRADRDSDALQPPIAPAGTSLAGSVSWAEGTRVHVGDRVFDAAEQVTAFVLTDEAAVVVGSDSTVRRVDAAGTEVIGTAADAPGSVLVADGSGGDRAAWYDNGASAFIVYDTATRSQVASVPVDGDAADSEGGGPIVRDIDGSDLWAYVAGSARRYDLTSGLQTAAIPLGRSGAYGFAAAAAGTVAIDPDLAGLEVREADGTVVWSAGAEVYADLSPTGRYLSLAVDSGFRVVDTETGVDVPFSGTYRHSSVVRWLGPDSFQASGVESSGDAVSWQVCAVSTRSCRTTSPFAVRARDVVRPTGEEIGFVTR